MTRSADDRDDPLARLLSAAGTDAPLPDPEFLARLREQSTEAFLSGGQVSNPSQVGQVSDLSYRRGRPMRAILAVFAAAAAVAGVLFWQTSGDRTAADGPTLDKVLADVAAAKTAHLKVGTADKARDVWTSADGRWREETADGTVRVADRDAAWRVTGETAKRDAGPAPSLDVLKLVLGETAKRPDLKGRKPDETVTRDGVAFLRYRVPVDDDTELEALVRADNGALHALAAKSKKSGELRTVAELLVLAVNEALPEDKFAILNTLSEDGRVGKVTDAQGVVAVLPLNRERWTPADPNLVLMPGDQVRTDTRGANAVAVKLVSRAVVTVGPASLVELAKPNQIKLHSGEAEIAPPKGVGVEVQGPNGQRLLVNETMHLVIDRRETMVQVKKTPPWLKGFRGTTRNESLGSLIAKVDGRDVPLTVGYHKVTVDIRDQIARTVVEESFVNHTPTTLEGVFHFPLPADASISGFGMWIGNELIEADVVEKQRARQIYEQIKSERRDPGLLEWSGGNIFTARIFPIFGNSEKRIKISYTQVLPLKGSKYRYSYALQSELLAQHPLKDLSITVSVSSAVPLKAVSSPSHSTRDQVTKTAARIEFSAQEYTPTRDFEVAIEPEGRAADVVVVPHRRGSDGYFMLQLMPPAGDLADRDVLPDGEPIRLLILADTSASMDRHQRQRQDAVLAALLGSLTARDSFNVAACDVTCDWLYERPIPADAQHAVEARDKLAKRPSLGWTDLDKAFATALAAAGPGTHVVYVGDGVVTARDADPVAFVKRLKQMAEGKAVTCHAVAVGSSYEAGVLKGIASLGGGSVRRAGVEQTPAAVARELVREIASPAVRNLKVEFNGIRTAAVYPTELPNLPPGSQQILLGRYMPEGADQVGEVVITGTQAGKPVRFAAPIVLKDAESGNSFVPRLWARMHLDQLLEQGQTEAIKDEVIALSEEFNIMTPYTSFLVLETDADRERFGVKRRFRMRDGEKFFAEHRDNVNFNLVQVQMKRAGGWRLGLRANVLKQYATLGRDPRLFQPVQQRLEQLARRGKDSLPMGGPDGGVYYESSVDFGYAEGRASGSGGGYGGGLPGGFIADSTSNTMMLGADEYAPVSKTAETRSEMEAGEPLDDLQKSDGAEKREQDAEEKDLKERNEPAGAAPPRGTMGEDRDSDETPGRYLEHRPDSYPADPDSPLGNEFGSFRAISDSKSRLSVLSDEAEGLGYGYYASGGKGRRNYELYNALQLLNGLFPQVPPGAAPAKEPPSKWPADALALSRSLLRAEALAKLIGGIDVRRTSEAFDARWNELSSRSTRRDLYSPAKWANRQESDGSQTIVSWCDAKERAVVAKAFLLGRIRAATKDDRAPQLDLLDYSLTALHLTYRDYAATVEKPGRLVLKHPSNTKATTTIEIDPTRHVLVSVEDRIDGKLTSATRFGDFVEVAGQWWPGKVESFDDKNRLISRTTYTVSALDAAAFDREYAGEQADRASVLFAKQPAPKVTDAKKAAADGTASTDDLLTLIRYFGASQQWAKVKEYSEQLAKKATDKPGVRWVTDAVLAMSRRNEELRQRHLDEAKALAKLPPAELTNDAYARASHLVGQAARVVEANEMMKLLDAVRPVYAKQPPHVLAMLNWSRMRTNYLYAANRPEEAIAQRKELAETYPRQSYVQREYADGLWQAGRHKAAFDWLTQALARNDQWTDWEDADLRTAQAGYLMQQGKYDDLLIYLDAWIKRNPASQTTPYQMYLSTLIRLDKVAKADETMAAWLREGTETEELKPDQVARFQAAISQAMGQGYQLYTNVVEERWQQPLADAALKVMRSLSRGGYADQIMQQHPFHNTDPARKARQQAARVLADELDTIPPPRIRAILNWTAGSDAGDKQLWEKVIAGLKRRWSTEKELNPRRDLATALVQLLQWKAESADVVEFLRLQLKEGPKEDHAGHARVLFDALLGQPWTQAIEDEAFTLLDQQTDSEDETVKRVAAVAALHKLTDKMIENRTAATMKAVEHPEKLTRTELRDKQDAARKAAREGFADRLAKEATARPQPLAVWLRAERAYLDVQLNRNLKDAEAFAWEVLGNAPPKPPAEDDEEKKPDVLSALLRQRAYATVAYLATRRGADAAAAEKVLKYIDRGIALGEPAVGGWKSVKYSFLVALDKPVALDGVLRPWVQGEDGNRWRVALGYLEAERGKLPEAVKLFEEVEASDELSPAGYRALANWYMVLNKRDAHDRATVAVYKMTDENTLYRRLNGMLRPWQRGGQSPPSELDKEVLLIFAALFEKSTYPQNFLSYIQQFYAATRDFRLLACVADAVVGQTAGKVYPFLSNMAGVLGEIRDEATVDEMMAHITKVARPKAKTAVDHRALDLMEMLVQRRAAELKNQPGPHGTSALEAMKRAFRRDWSPGEPVLMSELLGNLGRIAFEPLAEEQRFELTELHKMQLKGTYDRLRAALFLGRILHAYGRSPQAADLLADALAEFQAANNGVLTSHATETVSLFISVLTSMGHYARGETFLKAQLAKPDRDNMTVWYNQELDRLYLYALEGDGEVSYGKGADLYAGVEKRLRGEFATLDQNHRYWLFDHLCRVYRSAVNKKIAVARDDLRTFAFKLLPELIREQTVNTTSVVGTVAGTVHDLLSPRDGIAFLLDQIEREPAWFRTANQDGWSQHGYALAQWRTEAKDLGDLEPRLLKLVLSELRRDLENRQGRSNSIYHRNNTHYWSEKAGEFSRVAEEVYEKRKTSGESVKYIAQYLYWGLDRTARAVEILFTAHRNKVLDEGGRWQLVEYLHLLSRYAESVALLNGLIEDRPDNLSYRTKLMAAYYHLKQQAALLATLKAADTYFHEKDRWTEGPMAQLAGACLECELYAQSVAYFDEAIPLHERTAPRRGIGDGTLSGYYAQKARAYAGLKKTPEAIEAASAAVIAWGPTSNNRAQALQALRDVMARADDLRAYVGHLDTQETESGQGSPLLRKELGRVFKDRGEFPLAVQQLRASLELQPNDPETHQMLVECFDKTHDADGAIRQLLASAELSRRNPGLYADLGDRYARANRPADAERAYTSIVEMQPHEAEGHQALAEVRQKQDHWDDAAAQWELVVKLQSLEPTGLLGLANAEIHLKQWDKAEDTLRKVNTRTWPARFDNTVRERVQQLEQEVRAAKGK